MLLDSRSLIYRRCVLHAALCLSFALPVAAQSPAMAPAAAPPAASAAVQVLNDKVDAYMQAAIRNAHFSGTILRARDGVPLVSRAYGMANYELRAANSTTTVYELASVAKQFTVTLIMQLK